ncbi:MAG: hypothetical protein GEU93_01345 [Propionibacteriales bacterium]|nr:hypothetical protein [Propionibacteriales bacterium]
MRFGRKGESSVSPTASPPDGGHEPDTAVLDRLSATGKATGSAGATGVADSVEVPGAADAGSGMLAHDRLFPALFALGLLVLMALLYIGAYFFTDDRIPRSVSVAGVDIGGMRPAAAEEELRKELRPRARGPIVATYDGERFEINSKKAGLSLDVAETVDQAGGERSLNPLRMLSVLIGGNAVDPVVEVDEDRLTTEVEKVAERVDRKPVEGSISFAGTDARAEFPRPGRAVEVEETMERLREVYLTSEPVFELPVGETAPEVGKDAVRQALREFAEPAMSGPVTVRARGEKAVLSPVQLAPALSMRVVDGALEPRLDEAELHKHAGAELRSLTKRPKDAKVVLRDGRPRVVAGRVGTTIAPGKVAGAVLPALTETGKDRVVRLDVRTAKPAFTTKDARELGINKVVSDFTTYYPHSEYRNVNLGRATELIDGTVLKPGDTFSLNDTVGERTAENGFTVGYVIQNGALVEDFGGGVSQVATTLYNASFFAGLKDIEHNPHSLYFNRYPEGRESTVAWPWLDLRFQNDTPYGVLIRSWIEPSTSYSEGEMHAEIWSTKYWDIEAGKSERYNFRSSSVRFDPSPSCVEQTGFRGFDVDIYRYFHRNGERVETEKWHVSYNPAPTVHCRPRPEKNANGGDGGQGGQGGGGDTGGDGDRRG